MIERVGGTHPQTPKHTRLHPRQDEEIAHRKQVDAKDAASADARIRDEKRARDARQHHEKFAKLHPDVDHGYDNRRSVDKKV